MKTIRSVILFVVVVIMFSLANNIWADSHGERPSKWAQPIIIKGVPNLHKVSEGLYRSAQPTSEGMGHLKKLGIKTIVNLRSFHSDIDEIGNTCLGYVLSSSLKSDL